MKKLLIASLLLLAFVLCGCGAQDPAETAESYVGREVSELIDAIGEPNESFYQTSCAMADAMDGFLEYDGFTVITLQQADSETVQRVDIK